ncbi:MAG TPA: AAA family ATPase [Flexivirga sp.]|uniref:AAA family ATPase n=1 Tax=Flexivirga sp. TaxID=1962927 RepID=UPI002BC4E771|nr:AAA family ATPase [Flexivirga sp.]HWC23840.1 AAA family ATPase [Flexivirga sp.]
MTVDITGWVGRRIDEDKDLDPEVGLLVLAALEGDDALDEYLEHGDKQTVAELAAEEPVDPVGAFLKSIRVEGFRGIGEPVQVGFSAAPGLTIVAGRNGSGKSSIAEALEMALTGSTYRWKNKASQWRTQWRNLHQPKKAAIVVELAEEGEGITKVGVGWAAGEEHVDAFKSWMQRPGCKREDGTGSLGWSAALDTYRPMMSYDELGGLLEAGPSALHDALAKALGVEQLTDAIARLDARAKPLRGTQTQLNAQRRQLHQNAADLDDERAQQVAALLNKTKPDTTFLRDVVTGSESANSVELSGIRSLAAVNAPDMDAVAVAASELRSAVEGMAEVGASQLALRVSRADLRAQALSAHEQYGDMTCPVCDGAELDESWAQSSRELLRVEEAELAQLRQARERLDVGRREARRLIDPLPDALRTSPIASLEVVVDNSRRAWDTWGDAPAGDLDLAKHLDDHVLALAEAVSALREAADAQLQARQDLWAPVAARIAAFCTAWDEWLERKPQADALAAAAKWLKDNDIRLKNERLLPIADAARDAWSKLRQESNVELGSLTLEGANTRRRVNLSAAVDGKDTGALAVMSQGELHALSLALFLPRASMPESPFRFLVLDDPVQAMDPAKVEGLVQLLAKLAETQQVIVLSHDDRLPAAARRARVGARILEVTRAADSKVAVNVGSDPTSRYLRDARALLRDKALPEETLRKTLPGLIRFAVESCARDIFFERRLSRGESLADLEALWREKHSTSNRVSLAVFDDVRDLSPWLTRGYRRVGLGIATSGLHNGLAAGTDPDVAVQYAEDMVKDIRDGQKKQ